MPQAENWRTLARFGLSIYVMAQTNLASMTIKLFQHEVDLKLEGMGPEGSFTSVLTVVLLETHDSSLRASFWLTLANTLTFLLVLVGAVGWLLKQERQLAAAVNKIAKGDIALVSDVFPSGGPIGRIARRVEDMAAQLRTRDRERFEQEQ